MITSAIPTKSALHADVYDFAKALSERLLPRTTAYHEIWLDKKLVAGDAVHDFEPLYGEFYLPRKVCSFPLQVLTFAHDRITPTGNSLKLLLLFLQRTMLMSLPMTSGSLPL